MLSEGSICFCVRGQVSKGNFCKPNKPKKRRCQSFVCSWESDFSAANPNGLAYFEEEPQNGARQKKRNMFYHYSIHILTSIMIQLLWLVALKGHVNPRVSSFRFVNFDPCNSKIWHVDKLQSAKSSVLQNDVHVHTI